MRLPKSKGQKLTPLPKLHKKAWGVFSKWIRKRDNNICFTCGKEANQAGHYIHGDAVDFVEENIHAQCVRCNMYLSGNLGIYGEKLVRSIGQDRIDEIRLQKNTKKYTRDELEEIIRKYE